MLEFVHPGCQRPLLSGIAGGGTAGEKTRAKVAVAQVIMILGAKVVPLMHLTDLFLKGHPAQQIVDALGNG